MTLVQSKDSFPPSFDGLYPFSSDMSQPERHLMPLKIQIRRVVIGGEKFPRNRAGNGKGCQERVMLKPGGILG
jgi:hypothetical protein